MQFTTQSPPFTCGSSTISDYDGNSYNTVQIGSQCWLRENLKTTHYGDGTALVDGANAGDIYENSTTKYWFVYGHNPANKATKGLLYSWAAATNGLGSSSANPIGIQGVYPMGWHLPTDNEWKQLEMFLGLTQAEADAIGWRGSDQGGKLKSTSMWDSPNT